MGQVKAKTGASRGHNKDEVGGGRIRSEIKTKGNRWDGSLADETEVNRSLI
jgi:hypothetical protein